MPSSMIPTTAHQTAMMGPGMRLNLSSPAPLTMGTDKNASTAGDSFSPAALKLFEGKRGLKPVMRKASQSGCTVKLAA